MPKPCSQTDLKRKEELRPVLYLAAEKYNENLCNQNLMFVYKVGHNRYESFEAIFLPKHFKHLTGVKTKEGFRAVDFYNHCLDKRLSLTDFELAPDGTTWLKKDVLVELMSIHYVANCVGDYNGSRPKLITEKLSGNFQGCLGFVAEEENPNYFAPNTVLREPTRDMIKQAYQLVAVFVKEIKDNLYNRLTYTAKGFIHEDLHTHHHIADKLNKAETQVECKARAHPPSPGKKKRGKK